MLIAGAATTLSNRTRAGANAAHPIGEVHQAHVVLLLRWVLIVATSYLVLFSRPLSEVTPGVALFIAAYLGSNVLLTELAPRLRERAWLEWVLLIVDTAAVTVAVTMTDGSSNDLLVLYFAVLFLSALSERIGLVVGAAVLITVAHLYTISHFVDLGVLFQQGYMLRIPFLFVVALFFSHLVHHARTRERVVEEHRTGEVRLDLLSAFSHDLKNALGVVDSLADLLLESSAGPLNAQQADLTRRIQSSTRQVIALAQNLLDAERVETGRLVLQREPASVSSVIDDALVVAACASEIKGVTLDSHVEPGLPLISIDPAQIERVIANLLGNAIKFTPSGGAVRLTARTVRDAIEVEVADNGPGIAPDELPRLADSHYRGSRSRGVEGSGLGLFIVRAVVSAHGGALSIDSGVGSGTTVTVSLPLAESAASTTEEFPAAPARVMRAVGGASVG
jgi:signal transduction histidine kinase